MQVVTNTNVITTPPIRHSKQGRLVFGWLLHRIDDEHIEGKTAGSGRHR